MRKAHLLAALALPLGLAVACQSQTVGQAPLEDDPVFVGAEKTVVSPVGEPWTMFYFANETQDSLKDKLAGAAFFSSLGFEPFENHGLRGQAQPRRQQPGQPGRGHGPDCAISALT